MVTQDFNERQQLLEEVDEKIDKGLARGMDRIKLWIISAVVCLVMASGGSAMTFYFAVQSSIKTAEDNERRLNNRTGFIALSKAQVEQLQREAKRKNPDFEPIENVLIYE